VTRIASLLPSATEIAFALGLGDSVVGVTFECDYPPDPRVGRRILVGGLDTHGLDAAGIDDLVRARVASGELLYTLDDMAFREVDPDLVLTQDLCRVCALPSGDVDAAIDRLGCSATVLTLDPHDVEGVLDTIIAVGTAAGVPERAAALVDEFRHRRRAVESAVAGRVRPKVLVLEWPDPPFVAGHWVPELVSIAGGDPVLAVPGGRSVPTDWDAVATCGAEVVIVASCGFGLDVSTEHARAMRHRLPEAAKVWAIDANGLVVRPGPRLIDGIEMIAALLHGVGDANPAYIRSV